MQENEKKIKVMLGITKGIWGGAQEYVFSLATNLPKEKYDVSVVCGAGGTLVEKLIGKNIRTFTIGTMSRDIYFLNEIKSFLALWKIIKKEKPDILHLNSSKMGLLGGFVGRLLGVPKIIFTVHGLASNENRPFLVRKFFLFLHWLTVILSNTTIVVSEKTKNDLVDLPWVNQKIFVIHNGIEKINFEEKSVAQKYLADLARTEPTKIMIGTISELHKNKGLDFLILACTNLPEETSVYIVGDGEEKNNLTELIVRFSLEKKIYLVGRVENTKKYLLGFDIFTLTSRTEALPYTVLEAGLAGLPVVASRIGGIPEIIESEKSGILVQVGDIEKISKSLKNLVLEPQKRANLGQALQQKVEQDFSLQKMISETEKIYILKF